MSETPCLQKVRSGSDHIELTCTNPIKCTNCQGNHPSDSRNCMVWKREKEINQVKFTNNIPFPEARKIVQSQNNFPPKSYAQAATTNTEPKQHHSCQSCHALLERLSHLTPDTLPKFINDLKVSLLEDKPSQPSTSQPTVKSQPTHPPREVAKQVAPPQTTQSPPSPVRQSTRCPNRGLRQSRANVAITDDGWEVKDGMTCPCIDVGPPGPQHLINFKTLSCKG